VEHLKQWLPSIRSLRDVAGTEFEALSKRLPTLLRKRARHVITENARVHACARAIAAGEWDSVGALMNASHESLRSDYQVSSPELDDLVRLARGVPGVMGARMMGAGFGGCVIALVRRQATDALAARVLRKYPQVFACSIENGAEEIRK
jgi:galactokinase